MDKEIYRILKEYNSLYLKRIELEKSISQELSRIKKIEIQRSQRASSLGQDENTLKEYKAQLQKIEGPISTLSSSLQQNKDNINNVFTEQELNSINTQIKNREAEIEKLEEQGLDILDKIDSLEEEISNSRSFLLGSSETILEIEAEIKIENAPLFEEIKTIASRQAILKDQIPEKVYNKYTTLLSKKNPLTELDSSNVCNQCGYLVPKALADSVEIKLKFHTCSGCDRILIPQSTKY